jgi:hypothetical protein
MHEALSLSINYNFVELLITLQKRDDADQYRAFVGLLGAKG